MTLDTSRRREGYASRSGPASDEMGCTLLWPHAQRKAAPAAHQANRHHNLTVLVHALQGLCLLHHSARIENQLALTVVL